MFTYERRVRIQDTDAAGRIYFANLLQIGLEAFEEFLYTRNFSIKETFEKGGFFFPVVHVESDFFSPIYLGDLLRLNLTFPKIGTTSFTHLSEAFVEGKKVGCVKIVHVMCSHSQGKSVPIPDYFKEHLLKID